jgi:hypothetical protein
MNLLLKPHWSAPNGGAVVLLGRLELPYPLACDGVHPHSAYHLDATVPALPGLTQAPSMPVNSRDGAAAKPSPKDAPVATVEFDENGKLFPCSGDAECQVIRAKQLIEHARRERRTRHIVARSLLTSFDSGPRVASQRQRAR